MTIPLTTVGNNQTFGTWLIRTNDICGIIAQNTVTVDSTVGGSISTGNAYVNGIFGSAFLFAGNNSINTILTSSNITSTWGLSANSSIFNYSSNLFANTLNAANGHIVCNSSGVYAYAGLYANLLNIGSHLTVNSSGDYIDNLTVSGYANVVSLQASANISVGTSVLLTSSILSIGQASLASSNLVLGNSASFQSPLIYLANSSGSANLTTLFLSASWGLTSNSSGLYQNTAFLGQVTANNSGLYTTSFFSNAILANAATIGIVTSNATGLYSNALYGNASTIGLVTSNTTGLYANIISANVSTIGQVTSNSSGLYTNLITSSNLLINFIGIGNSTINAIANSSTFFIGNSITNASINTMSFFVGNSSDILIGVNTSGVYTNNNLNVTGNFYVGGNLTTTGTTIGTGNYIPSTNSFSLGNTTNRWTLWAISTNVINDSIFNANVNVSGYVSIGNSIIIGNSTVNSVTNSTSIIFSNPSLVTTVNSTSYSGTANNALYIGGLIATNVVSNAQLSGNLANYLAINSTSYSGTANNALYIGGLIATNVVSNAQLSGNLANYTNTSLFTSNLSNYQATATLNANIATYLLNYVGSLNASSIAVGNSTSNVVANAAGISLANGIASIIITSPNSTQTTNNQYYLNANGAWTLTPIVNGSYNYSSSGLSAQTVDYYTMSTYKGAEYLLSVVDNNANNRYFTKCLTTHDTNNAYITEWGMISTNSLVGSFSTSSNATSVLLQFTATTSNNVTVSFVRTIL